MTELGHELITTDKKPFQRYWSSAVHKALFHSLKAGAPPSRLARILTAAQGHSGDWITAYQIAQVGTRLEDETLWISVALRVGLNVCLAHQCRCRATVQSDVLHPLSCRFCAGRFPRHSAINNIIKRSLDTAGLHSILEPVGLDRGDGRRPDGVTSFPFKGGKALAWDATCTDSFSASNLYSTILNPGSASSAAKDLKRQKYPQLVADFEFVPVAVETSRIIGSAGCSLLTDIGAAFRGPPLIPARCLTSFNRFQLPSSEATPWLLQPHQGNMSRSWLRDTDSQNGDALLCIYYINKNSTVKKKKLLFRYGLTTCLFLFMYIAI